MIKKIKNKIHEFLLKRPSLGHFFYEIIRLYKKNKDYWNGNYDVLYILKKFEFEPSVIYDVGANRSEWSRNIKSLYNKSEIYLFEPIEKFEPFLKRFCKKYTESKYFMVGLGNKIESAGIDVYDDFAGSSLLYSNSNSERIQTIQVQTIDSLISQNKIKKADLIKIDVQGFEIKVLEGGLSCLGYSEIIILETCIYDFLPNQPILSDVILFMKKHGYIVFDFTPLIRHKKTGALRYFDTVFIKSDSKIIEKVRNLPW